MLLRKSFRFEASHVLPKHPGKCSRLHGHSWILHVAVRGPVNDATGFVMDYGIISTYVKRLIVDKLDHSHLGQWVSIEGKHPFQINGPDMDSIGDFNPVGSAKDEHGVEALTMDFYPSSENLLHWIGNELVGSLDWDTIALEETCTSYAELSRTEFDAQRHKG